MTETGYPRVALLMLRVDLATPMESVLAVCSCKPERYRHANTTAAPTIGRPCGSRHAVETVRPLFCAGVADVTEDCIVSTLFCGTKDAEDDLLTPPPSMSVWTVTR